MEKSLTHKNWFNRYLARRSVRKHIRKLSKERSKTQNQLFEVYCQNPIFFTKSGSEESITILQEKLKQIDTQIRGLKQMLKTCSEG